MNKRVFSLKLEIIFLFVPLMILLLASCSSVKVMNGKWLTSTVELAGKNADLSKQLNCYLFDNGMMVGLGNDENNLYVFFTPNLNERGVFPSQATLTLWLDATGKNSRTLGLEYVCGYFPDRFKNREVPADQASRERTGENRGADEIKRVEALAKQIKVIDKIGKRETVIPADGSQGPLVRFSSDWGEFTYEWRIPIQKKESGDYFFLAARPGQTVGIGLLWQASPLMEARKRMGNENAASMPRGMGGGGGRPGGFGGGRGMRGGMEGGRGMSDSFSEQMPKKCKIWIKTVLGKKEN